MINLLPPNDKKELANEKTRKVVIILGYTILLLLVCLILITSLLRVFILDQVAVFENKTSESQRNFGKNYVDLKNEIQEINKETLQLNSFYKNNIYLTKPLKIISEISRPDGLYFTNVYASEGSKKEVLIIISGFADTRDNLLTYKDNLEKDKRIKNLSFSTDSWTKTKNINFYLNVNIENTQ